MEPRFKTSFIPKQSLASADVPQPSIVRRPSGPGGIGTVITLLIFLGTIGFAGGLFLYESYLNTSIASKQDQLRRAREAFQPALIRQMARLDTRLDVAEKLLQNHYAPSLFFQLLQDTTLQTVQFTTLDLALNEAGARFALDGQAQNFSSVALQSDVFGTNQFIREPVITEFNIIGNGRVGFKAQGAVDRGLLLYSQTVSVDQNSVPQQ